jgi:hypothetical protein
MAVIHKFKSSYVNGRINIRIFTSIDNGVKFYYSGVGRFCPNLIEAKNYLKLFAN